MNNAHRLLLVFIIINLLVVGVCFSPVLAQAENEQIGFSNVRLWINPEYDDPRLLVMLEGQLVGVEPPVEVRFLVPSAAEMYSAGSMDAQRQYTGGPPHREPSSIPGWDEISYEVTTDTFRVEYYDPIIIGQPDKTISYEFRWLYPISDIQVFVQEPRGASNFGVFPGGEPFIDSAGFNTYLYAYSDPDDESPIQFEVTYTKSDPNPSLAIVDDKSGNTLLIAGIVVVVVVLFGIGVFWFRKSKPKIRAERRRHAAQNVPVTRSKGKGRTRKFCTQCGQRLESPSPFCPHCGAKL